MLEFLQNQFPYTGLLFLTTPYFSFVLSFLVAVQFESLLLASERQRFNPLSDCLRVLILVDGFDCVLQKESTYPIYIQHTAR